MTTARQIAEALGGAKRLADGWAARCPAHEDRNPSLSIADGDGSRLLVHCHAGCEQRAVWDALQERGLITAHPQERMTSTAPASAKKPGPKLGKPPANASIPAMVDSRLGKPSSSWCYRDVDGSVLFYVARYDTREGKQLKPWCYDTGAQAWVCRAYPKPRPLYGLDRLAANPQSPVLIVEGEKCADAAQGAGYVAITWCGGSNAVTSADWAPLKGRDVTIWPDADEPGAKAAVQIRNILGSGAILDVSGRPDGWDVADAVAEGWTPDKVLEFIEAHAKAVELPESAEKKAAPFSYDIAEIAGLYRIPDPVWGVAIQRGRVHALTSPTNHGKTAVVTTIIPAVALGLRIGADDVRKGKVLALVGENPEDFYGRLMATMGELSISFEEIAGRVRIIPHAFGLRSKLAEVQQVAQQMGEVILVVVDTNASYYGYEDELNNLDQRAQAADLRELTRLPGNPAVLATCHPVKNPSRDNLMPRGGGGFLNEIDTNLIVWKDGDVATFHFQHKIRGPSFEPIKLQLTLRPIPGQYDDRGRVPQTVVAMPLTDSQVEIIEHRAMQDENKLLRELDANPRESIAKWAENLAWVTPKGEAHKSKVHRLLGALEVDKLVRKVRGKYTLTANGKKVLDDLA